jgi:hypothetical protein
VGLEHANRGVVILPAALVVVAVIVGVCGRDLRRVALVPVRHGWLIGAAFGIQVLIVNVLPTALPDGVAAAAHIASYLLAAVFVWSNRRLAGLPVLAVGGALNFAAILANGGVMPASASALDAAGREAAGEEFTNSGAVEDARLAFLGDVFALPEPLPLANVFSIGDIVIVIGAAVLLLSATSRPGTRSTPEAVGALD